MKKPTEKQYELAQEVWLDFCEGSLSNYAYEPHPFLKAYEDYQEKYGEITTNHGELLDLITEAIAFGVQATGYESSTNESYEALVSVCRDKLASIYPSYTQLEIPGLELLG